MKKKILILVFTLAAGAIAFVVFVFSAPVASPKLQDAPISGGSQLPEGEVVVVEVVMDDEGYQPNTITLKAGQAVRFVNKSSSNRWPASNIHPTHDLYPEFDPQKELKPGETWTFTFRKKGTWRMHDHLFSYMKGIVTVN